MKKVLIVDDDRLFLNSMARALTGEGYEVDQAQSGEEALNKLHQQKFDLIVLDYKMQPIDGMEVLRTIHQEGFNIPVVMITAYGTFDMATEALSFDVITVLPKPVEMDRLKTVVKNAIRGQHPRARTTGRPIMAKDGGSKPPVTNGHKPAAERSEEATKNGQTEAQKKILVVDDSRLFRKMIISTIQTTFKEFGIVEAEDGLDALEKLNQNNINLIILDINMPHMNGLEFMKLKRKSEKFKQIPVVVLTTEKEKETMGKAYLSGATVFMNKPFQRQELIKVLKTMSYWHVK